TWPSRMQTLGPEELAYVEKVRRATRRFGDRLGEDVEGALQAVRNASHFDVEAPTVSTRREVALVKAGVKRLSSWYMRYLSAQLEAFGATLVRMGEALSSRTGRLEERADQLEANLTVLGQRLGRIERGGATRPSRPRASSGHEAPASEAPAGGSGSGVGTGKRQRSGRAAAAPPAREPGGQRTQGTPDKPRRAHAS
ncbi:MAG TPA: hypothetical protein VK425_10965, partial [Acidimicrobiales bacterium]|nr:hypothetical protein [Acidimicrobiales bacterium]